MGLSAPSSSPGVGVSSFIHWRLPSHCVTLPGPVFAPAAHRRRHRDERDEDDDDEDERPHRLPPLDIANARERAQAEEVDGQLDEVRRADRDDHREVVVEANLGERGAPDERRPHDEVQLLGVVLDEERRADEQGGRDEESDHLPAHADDAADGVVELGTA